jgi:GNAT superfamily N-acetyltransferase
MPESNPVDFRWRGEFANGEVHALHAEAFNTRLYEKSEWNWVRLCQQHSLGWVVAREAGTLVGFVNVLWDGLVHAYLEDMMVAADHRHRRIGVGLVHAARDAARTAGCEYLHVSFEEDRRPFYIDACGFAPIGGGLIDLV